MASYTLAGRCNGSAGIAALPLAWHIPSNYTKGQGYAPIPDAIGVHAEVLTPSDLVEHTPPFRWCWIGSEGDVSVQMNDGSCMTWSAVPAGTRLPISFTMLLSPTTASNVIGVR